ncbi:unnamed protein product [Rotaria sp. Silwood1]|nr:unnamed protein product [Rotaria sp. Silwood1]
MWLHDKFSDAEKLLKYNPNWVLYTISERYVYFTLLPKPISEYNVKNAPFIFVKLFTDARQLARMPIKDFFTFACHSLAPMKGKVVFFTNCPRSGSTLITQMVRLGQQAVTIAEPMTFTNLVMMYDENILSLDLFNAILRSLFYTYCKDMTEDQIYIMKTPSEGAVLVGHIHKLLPEIIHIFQFRENVEKVLISSYKMMQEYDNWEAYVYLNTNFPKLGKWLFGYQYEKRTTDKVKPQGLLELTMVIFGAPYSFF